MSQPVTLVFAGSLGPVGVAMADDPQAPTYPQPNKGERSLDRPQKPWRDSDRPAPQPGEPPLRGR